MRTDFIFLGPLKVELTEQENKEADKRIVEFCSHMGVEGQSEAYLKEKRNAHKPMVDIYVGKKAEEFVAKAFGIPYTMIDYEVRVGKSKGWHPDFFDNWHVKGCTEKVVELIQRARGVEDKSWTFQVSNVDENGGTDPLLTNNFTKTQYIFFVYMQHPEDSVGYIELICPWRYIDGCTNHLLENPIYEHLKKIKKCVYLSTMAKYFKMHPERISRELIDYRELT